VVVVEAEEEEDVVEAPFSLGAVVLVSLGADLESSILLGLGSFLL
jgi:hypothetical protein